MRSLSLFLSLLLPSLCMAGSPRSPVRVHTSLQQREGGGFMVRRSVGSPYLTEVDPFLMLDHLGPTTYGPGEAVGAPDHPHRGFETVTYVLSGGFHHLDNSGNEGNLGPGWAQWMTAGSGVIHSEMPIDSLLRDGGDFEGFQLWVNLPAKDKMIAPRYQDTPPERIPKVTSPDGMTDIAIIAGRILDTDAAIETRTPIMFFDISIKPGGRFTAPIPASHKGFVYIYRGDGTFGPDAEIAREGQFFALSDGTELEMSASGDDALRLLLIAGEPIGEPVFKYGPFVMNTRDEVIQAIKDYNEGRFGKQIGGAKERMWKTEAAKEAQKGSGKWDEDTKRTEL